MKCNLTICLLFVIVGSAVYANSIYGPFIYDDFEAIENNQTIRQLWPPWQALWPPKQLPVSGRPVVNLSLAINYQLGGLDVRGYHVLNIAVHILCALVLYGIIRRTLLGVALRPRFSRSAEGLAGLCALIWLVHPMQSECVNYIIQRTESIMALFYLLTLYSAVRGIDSPARVPWSIACVLFCALGMASKETMVTAPIIVFLYDWSFRSQPLRQVWRRRWGVYIGLAATWSVLGFLMATGPRSASVSFAHGLTSLDHALNQCMMIVEYLHLAAWPHPLVLDYGVPEPRTLSESAPYVVAVTALGMMAVTCFLSYPKLGFLGICVFVILGPTSSVVPISTEVGAERRMYLPLAAVIILSVLAISWLGRRIVPIKQKRDGRQTSLRQLTFGLAVTVAAIVVVVLSALTIRRNRDYQSEVSIWQTVVIAAPQNVRGHYNLARAFEKEKRFNEAVQVYRHAIEIDPNEFRSINNLRHLLLKNDQVEEAVAIFREVLETNPDSVPANLNLARSLRRAGQLTEAIVHYRRVLNADLDDPDTLLELAQVLSATGKISEAIEFYRTLAKLHPKFESVHYELGLALQANGQIDDAIQSFRHAARLIPSSPLAHNALAWMLAIYPDSTHHNPQHALELAERAARLAESPNPSILDTLATAHAAAGQYDLAVRHAEQALEMAKTDGNTALESRVAARLALFRQRKPFYEPPRPPAGPAP